MRAQLTMFPSGCDALTSDAQTAPSMPGRYVSFPKLCSHSPIFVPPEKSKPEAATTSRAMLRAYGLQTLPATAASAVLKARMHARPSD